MNIGHSSGERKLTFGGGSDTLSVLRVVANAPRQAQQAHG